MTKSQVDWVTITDRHSQEKEHNAPLYSLSRYLEQSPMVRERIIFGSTNDEQEERHATLRSTLADMGRRLEDETPAMSIRDEMMKDLEQLETEFVNARDSKAGSKKQ